jgi:crotonobetainyl-CoA:carnitine CoA-transferase CaiB-like acyl-CoA transferase
MLGFKAAEYRLTGDTTARMGSRCNIQVVRDVYATSDGKYVALSTGTQGMAERLSRAIGRADLVDDPRFRTNADRLAHREELEAIVRDFIAAPAPALGQHNDELLRGLGYTDAEILALAQGGVVGRARDPT